MEQDAGLEELLIEFRRMLPAQCETAQAIDRQEPFEKIALKAIDRVMNLERERPPERSYISRRVEQGLRHLQIVVRRGGMKSVALSGSCS